MKKFTRFLLLGLLVIAAGGCAKTTVQSSLQGTWIIKKTELLTGVANYARLDFLNGSFTFNDNGTVQFLDAGQDPYNGTWQLSEKEETGYCYNDANGDQVCNSITNHILQVNTERVAAPSRKKNAYFDYLRYVDPATIKVRLTDANIASYEYTFQKIK